jgi:hypothetical protein
MSVMLPVVAVRPLPADAAEATEGTTAVSASAAATAIAVARRVDGNAAFRKNIEVSS